MDKYYRPKNTFCSTIDDRPKIVNGIVEASTRVYINPNFKRNQRPLPQLHNNIQMHINPNFSQQLCDRKLFGESNRSRIHINPNFIRIKQAPNSSSVQTVATTGYPYNQSQTTQCPQVYNGSKSLPISCPQLPQVYTAPKSLPMSCPQLPQPQVYTSSKSLPMCFPQLNNAPNSLSVSSPITKSRYSIVRQNNAPEKKLTRSDTIPKTTCKISKYKSVTMHNLQKSLNSLQYFNESNQSIQSNRAVCTQAVAGCSKTSPAYSNRYRLVKSKPHTVSSRYRIVKTDTTMTLGTPLKGAVSRRLSIVKNTPRSMRVRIKENKKIFKKNNIPCPLYRKYGKCLRNGRGDCEFLHDKKHVSICRKFLKGICHDKECLLSHEISKEKMPTCSFYLKGMCTKEDCPYLHVKLNENTKICSDFLKGYCKKGDECLNRHINVCPDMAAKEFCNKKRCPYPHRQSKNNSSQTKIYKKTTKSHVVAKQSSQKNSSDNNVTEDDKNYAECRYYRDAVSDEANTSTNMTDVIKPSRCKLGTLPSFIQL